MIRGRRPLPLATPNTAQRRIAWLLRCLRVYSTSPEVRNTNDFSRRLHGVRGRAVTAETINKLESGHLLITGNTCEAYERTLDLTEHELLDTYIYAHRVEDETPAWTRIGGGNGITSHDVDLLAKVTAGDPLTSYEWLEVADCYAENRTVLGESQRLRSVLFPRLVDAACSSYERDFRLIREAMIRVGPSLVGEVVEAVARDPIHAFNALESFGWMQGEPVTVAAAQLAAKAEDGVVAQTAFETLARVLGRSSIAEVDPSLSSDIGEFGIRMLLDVDEAYTAREEALRIVALLKPNVSPRKRNMLRDLSPDLAQLRLRGTQLTPRVLSEAFSMRLAQIRATVETEDLPLVPPGLQSLIGDAVFGDTRTHRLTQGVLLSACGLTGPVSNALGRILIEQVEPEDYGVQRSLLRLMTKIGSPESDRHFYRFATSRIAEDNTRLTVAWALGGSRGAEDSLALAHLLQTASGPICKRVVVNSALRRGFVDVLEIAANDPSASVSREARKALISLQPRVS